MARTFSGAERTAIAGAAVTHLAKFEVTNYDGTWIDLTSWVLDLTLDEDIDANSMILSATVQRDDGALASLAPLRTDSSLNLDDSLNYQPLLDLARQWRLSVSVTATGAAANWKYIGQGYYDIIDINHPSPTILLTGRDSGAVLLDRWIEVERTYGDDTTPVAMETVLQSVLDDNGFSAITLYTPTSPSFVLKKFTLTDQSVMAALNLVASRAGFVVRYRYDASNNFRLTLYAPDRDAGPGDEAYTLDDAEYTNLPVARLDVAGVRNRVLVSYYDAAAADTLTVLAENTTSQTRYGGIPRVLQIDLARDPNLQTSARAQDFADLVLSDLAAPSLEQQIEVPGFWIAQLGDYVKCNANGVHYDTTQYGGVTHIKHSFRAGTMRTTLNLRGAPSGRYRSWLANVTIRGVPGLAIKNFRETARTDTTVTFGWELDGLVNELWLWLATEQEPIASDPWPATDTAPDYRLTATTTSYQVTLPNFGYVVIGQLCSVDADGNISAPWQFKVQSQNAPRLNQRASASTTDATTVTVVVAVADPQPLSNISIAHSATGCSVDLASPQTILAASVTSDITTTGTVTYVVTRPAFGAGTGRVTFTATATDRDADTDAVDVPAQERDTVPLFTRAKTQTTNATTVVIRAYVADPVASGGSGNISVAAVALGCTFAESSPQSIASGSVTTDIDTTGYTEWTITRPAYLAGSGRVVFTSTRTGRAASTDAIDVPAQEGDVLSDPENMIANGGGNAGLTGVQASGWTNRSGNALTCTTAQAKFGTRSLEIDNSGGAADSSSSQDFDVDNGGVYELSGWVKTDSINGGTGTGAGFNVDTVSGVTGYVIYDYVGSGWTAGAPDLGVLKATGGGTVDWTFFRVTFGIVTSGTIRVHCQLGFGGTCPGKAWFDGVKLRRIVRPLPPVMVRTEHTTSTDSSKRIVTVKGRFPTTATGTCTVTYDAGGLTVTPTSGGTFAGTNDWSTTGSIAYTVTKPAYTGVPSRVAFTVSAPGHADGTDGADIEPIFRDFSANKITASEINVSTLSAITAEVGSLTVTDGTSTITFQRAGPTTTGSISTYYSSAGAGTAGMVFTVSHGGTTKTLRFTQGAALPNGFRVEDTNLTAGDDLYVMGNIFVFQDSLDTTSGVVSLGANDSGGTGYRVLRIPNA